MPRQATISINNTAAKGLITEATGLNFPENAWTDALNVTPDNKGITERRKGIDYELNSEEFTVVRNDTTMATGRWTNVAGLGTRNFVVVQNGSTLYFYEEVQGESLSSNKKSFSIDLTSYDVAGNPGVSDINCEFASGKGYLFVTHKYCDPFYVAYDPNTDTITVTSITIQCRDFEGVDDGLDPDERLSTMSEAHEYNLLNQGWDARIPVVGSGSKFQAIDRFKSEVTLYPSNSEQWWAYKTATDQADFSTYVDGIPFGNSLAPKGHYILDWFATARSDISSRITDVDERSAGYFRPTACAFFAGRVWYAGVESQDYVGEVYFSQIIERVDQFGKCYQSSDPTSEVLSDLLATDGGVVNIQDIGSVYKLFATQKSLLIFSDNGIWSISGSDVSPFKATEYSVNKVSGIRSVGNSSFVEVQGFPVWWNQEGIYIIRSDELNNFKIESITDTTIKTFYQNIPPSAKLKARGAYDPIDQVIHWVYNDDPDATGDGENNFNRILVLNTATGALYPWEVDQTAGVYINSVLASNTIASDAVASYDNVIDGSGDNVVDGSGNEVIVQTMTSMLEQSYSIKYLVSRNIGSTNYRISFAEEYDPFNRDWRTIGNGVSYSSYFEGGYQLKGDAQRFGQENYIVVYSNVLQNASAFINVIWDYGKVTGAVNQIYRNVAALGIIQTRLMLRGRGRVFQFKITSDADYPFEVIGWSVFETQNSSV